MKKTIIAVSLLAALALTSCGSNSSSSSEKASLTTAPETSAAAETTAETTSAEPSTEHETAPQNEVGYEGMNVVSADALKDGEYHISVDSSSSMFKIADCILYVENGSMSADIIIASKSYDALFMGTEDEAKGAPDSERITYTSNESGQSVFRVPVEALDKEIQCAALSAKKQEWYGRTLVFRADSLPDGAFAESRYKTAADLGLEDGEYTVEVKLEGGSGKASVQSPAELTIKDGNALAKIVWSSDKYDKMVVQEKEYAPEIKDGHSVFEIPVTGFDFNMPVSAETTAMSEPHMIDYTLLFDSSTVKK
ncbi:hypothetical protein [uncultured Ruminococcus sp.]|uniref:hypothetical protein n=1 Tax=uncultured Ruminococcus sp. TaxID=165186 RepID=UPI002607D3E8|nr:hypothetical protein [uncultured Ruminococcus sp.]